MTMGSILILYPKGLGPLGPTFAEFRGPGPRRSVQGTQGTVFPAIAAPRDDVREEEPENIGRLSTNKLENWEMSLVIKWQHSVSPGRLVGERHLRECTARDLRRSRSERSSCTRRGESRGASRVTTSRPSVATRMRNYPSIDPRWHRGVPVRYPTDR